ncbi:phospholipase D-like domain-containing protein [Proteus vulgaris]|uniref:phospholipase D-like domain-containing protein n=1 Tax=Proteus vulgaris TaxID=585 RepID=UPI001FFF3EB1|nr:phospholipase D-like domain-containing protein [Proteus vulgaris]UPK81034.1 phospholipase D-like domain-containing protein [Proteus vulgaris]
MTTETTLLKTPQIFNLVPSQGACSVITNEWFIRDGYSPMAAGFAPLINGERTFKALANAIKGANKSINIAIWGFQASMYFTRVGTEKGSERIGELLKDAAERGVTVRLLVWFSELGNRFDPQFPGWDAYSTTRTDKNIFGEYVDGYGAQGKRVSYETKKDYEYDRKWHFDVKHQNIGLDKKTGQKKLFVACRAFNWGDDRASAQAQLKENSFKTSGIHEFLLSNFPTHHQKFVIIDYEEPKDAVGFIMGHNMVSGYWDNDAHDGVHKETYIGRDGDRPWQDISSCVCGGVLADLYHSFEEAWAKDVSTDYELSQGLSITAEDHKLNLARMEALNKKLELDSQFPLQPTMGQICRTQPQQKKFEVEEVYNNAVALARNYIYMENQYFRYPPLAKKLKKAVEKRRTAGCKDTLYLFVVTNTTALKEMEVGSFNTYRMLDELERPDLTPNFHRKSKGLSKKAEVKAKKIEGLETVICTLVSPNPDITQTSLWQPTYVHSKVLMVDDVFMTIGSSNINYRSMRFDSELNINLQDTDSVGFIKSMREFLWQLHSGGIFDNIKREFTKWNLIISRNKLDKKTESYIKPFQPLIQFLDENRSWSKKE